MQWPSPRRSAPAKRGPAAWGRHHCVLIDSRADYDRGARIGQYLGGTAHHAAGADAAMGAGASAEPRPRPQPRIIRLGQGNHGNFILLDGRARAQPQMIIHRNGTLVANNGTTNGLSLQPGSSLAILAALAASELRLQAALERTEAARRVAEAQEPAGPAARFSKHALPTSLSNQLAPTSCRARIPVLRLPRGTERGRRGRGCRAATSTTPAASRTG